MPKWEFVEYQELASGDRSAFSMGPFGSKITKDNYIPSGVPVVRGTNLAKGIFIDEGFVFISDSKADEISSSNVLPGDLIFTHRGTIGQVSMLPRNPRYERYTIGSSQVKTRLDESRALPEFYYYWFQSPEGQLSILANSSTVGVPGIATPLTSIRKLKVPHPTLSEQRAIAEVLGALDDKIALNERITETIINLSESLYIEETSPHRSTFSVRLKSAARWLSGGTPRSDEPLYWSGSIPWISGASLKQFIIRDSDRRVTGLGAANGTKMAPTGATLCLVRGMSLKTEFRVGIATRPVAFGQDCKALIAADGIGPHTLAYAIRSKRGQVLGLVDEAGHGTGRLDSGLLGSVEIEVPSGPEAATLESKLADLTMLATAHEEESAALIKLRDTLLPKLMSGEIRVHEPESLAVDSL